jgi:ATPase subunit of ABC transporter with duplicated ATPase domains
MLWLLWYFCTQNYQGLLLVVSHDRAFMEGATQQLLVLPGDGSVDRFHGNYSKYLQQLQQLRQQQQAAAQEQTKKAR